MVSFGKEEGNEVRCHAANSPGGFRSLQRLNIDTKVHKLGLQGKDL
jgi:hypothetical protein